MTALGIAEPELGGLRRDRRQVGTGASSFRTTPAQEQRSGNSKSLLSSMPGLVTMKVASFPVDGNGWAALRWR